MLLGNPFLLPAAFEAVPTDAELESELSLLYGAGVERVSEYSADRLSPFWTQMEELEGLYRSMATGAILCSESDGLFHKLKINFYTPIPDVDYSAFYQGIKSTLETILILMREKSETDQQKIIQKINAASGVCGPGLFTNLQEIATSLRKMEGLCFWLAESRRNLLTLLADRYITAYKISGGMSIHVHFAFYKIANEAGLSIPGSEAYAEVPDTFARPLGSRDDMKKKFLTAFKREYSRAYILETLIARFREALGSFERIEALSTEQYQNVIRILKSFTEGDSPVFNLSDALWDGEEKDDDASLSSSWKIKTDFFESLPGYCKALAIKQGILADLDAEGFVKIPASRLKGIDIFGIPLDKIDWTATEPPPLFFASMEQILALFRMEEIHLDFSHIHLSDREIPHQKLDGEQVKLLYSKGFRNFRGYDLSGADLTGANLSGAQIQGAKLDRSTFVALYAAGIKDFRFCDLTRTDLALANLSGTNLARAYLHGANLTRANLTRANLHGANLSGADLSGANLSGADLSDVIIQGAKLDRSTFMALYAAGIRDFRSCDLTRADLFGADLSGANLSGVYLTCTNLSDADLSGVNLSSAYLTGADLTDADLSGADLSGADLTSTNLSSADLRGAHLSGANLSNVIIHGAKFDRSTFMALYAAGIRDFCSCNLSGADLITGANLTGADLTGADLSGADLTGADLTGADLSNVDLTYATLIEAILADTNLSGADLCGANFCGATLSNPTLGNTNVDSIWIEPDVFRTLYAAKDRVLNFDETIELYYRDIEKMIPFLNSLRPDSHAALLAITMTMNQDDDEVRKKELLSQWIESDECFLEEKRPRDGDSDRDKARQMIDDDLEEAALPDMDVDSMPASDSAEPSQDGFFSKRRRIDGEAQEPAAAPAPGLS